eukprot:TRINITY_DN14064_c0_g1_i1.p1 TRINITY_DN14064_c0_g1~~TRINITY_DN14064_c0_g1_i1.p1  ORF type:complete len:272 (-),score=38.44 TRINITY_DN14064_c0_g1_i1:297-1112(-)
MADRVKDDVVKRFLRRQEEIRGWISDFLGNPVPEDPDEFRLSLCDGSVLLHLVKAIDTNSAALPTRAKMRAGQTFENIHNFLKAAEYVGVRKDELFSVPDLVDNHDWPKVIYCLQALADLARRRNFEVEMRKVDESKLEISEKQTERLLEVIAPTGGLSAAATKLQKVEVAEKTFQETHETGGAIASAASGLATALMFRLPDPPKKEKVVKAVKAVKSTVQLTVQQTVQTVAAIDPRDALPPAWISALFFIIFFSYILLHPMKTYFDNPYG